MPRTQPPNDAQHHYLTPRRDNGEEEEEEAEGNESVPLTPHEEGEEVQSDESPLLNGEHPEDVEQSGTEPCSKSAQQEHHPFLKVCYGAGKDCNDCTSSP